MRQASPDDAPVAAFLLYLSGPSCFRYGLNLSEPEVLVLLQMLWPLPRHLFSYQWAQVACVGDAVRGLLLGYPGRAIRRAERAMLPIFWRRFTLRRLLTMGRHAWELARITARVPTSDYYIAHLAVLPEARSQGLGRQLLQRAEEVARMAGCRRCALDVLIENERARALYERSGYVVERVLRNPRLQRATGCSGAMRMAKPLP